MATQKDSERLPLLAVTKKDIQEIITYKIENIIKKEKTWAYAYHDLSFIDDRCYECDGSIYSLWLRSTDLRGPDVVWMAYCSQKCQWAEHERKKAARSNSILLNN